MDNSQLKDEENLKVKEIDEFIHILAAKNGRKKFKFEYDKTMEEFINSIKYLAEKHLLHDRIKFYPCKSDRIKVNKKNEKYFFLERIININNRNKGILTESLLSVFALYPEEYFEEFLKIGISTYHKEVFSSRDLYLLMKKYLPYFSDIIGRNEDIYEQLADRKIQIQLYNLISSGGLIYQARNSLLCFKSLFYKRKKYDNTEEFYNDAKIECKKVKENFSIEELNLEEETILNLISSGYLNKRILDIEVKSLLERNFYIPKKKRRKRIYTEEKEYLVTSNKDISSDVIIYSIGHYLSGDRKIKRDKKSFKKRYIPEIRNEKMVDICIKNELYDTELYNYAYRLISNSK